MSNAVQQAGLKVGLNLMEDKDDKCCDLTMKQRWIGSFICSGLSVVLAVISFIVLSSETKTFAILYTLSIIAALAASFFVAGPKKHWTRLIESPAHLISAIAVLVAIVMVFVAVFAVKSTALAIVILIVEIVALVFFYLTLYQTIWVGFKACVKRILPCG
jgi:hypothetical protein